MLLLNPVREQVRALDKDQPLGRPITLEEMLGSQTVQLRFTMALFSFFAALGLALAAADIYSVALIPREPAHARDWRPNGARRGDVLRLTLTMGGRLVIAGVALGVPASLGVTRLLQSQLFGVKPTDPAAYVGVAALLGIVTLAALHVPAPARPESIPWKPRGTSSATQRELWQSRSLPSKGSHAAAKAPRF